MSEISVGEAPESVLKEAARSLNGENNISEIINILDSDPVRDDWAIPEDESCRDFEAVRIVWKPHEEETKNCAFEASRAELREMIEAREIPVACEW